MQIRTTLGAEDLLFKLKEIEADMGRKPHIRYGPRIIDLDLLFYGNIKHNTSILTVPHPQLHERDFVLGPLMDICPDFVRFPYVHNKNLNITGYHHSYLTWWPSRSTHRCDFESNSFSRLCLPLRFGKSSQFVTRDPMDQSSNSYCKLISSPRRMSWVSST
jgi:hypothetical protein